MSEIKAMNEEQVYVYDPRQKAWLCDSTFPAQWTPHKEIASTFRRSYVHTLFARWSYLRGCDLQPKEVA